MAPQQKLYEYERCGSLHKEQVNITLKKHDISIKFDVPSYGHISRHELLVQPENPTANDSNSLSRVLQGHIAFKIALQPDVAISDSFYELCAAEVNAISLFFPDIDSERIRICFTAWLAFACAMDDIMETLSPEDRTAALFESMEIMRCHSTQHIKGTDAIDKRIQGLTEILRAHCQKYLSQTSTAAFFKAVQDVLQAHVDEIRFLTGQIPNDLPTYLGIRSRTISLNPFFEVIKCEYLPAELRSNTAWDELQLHVCRAAGLQNDLIGLERDLEMGEQMNAVIVLLQEHCSSLKGLDKTLYSRCIGVINEEHNRCIAQSLDCTPQFSSLAGCEKSVIFVEEVMRHVISLGETHLKWCASAKRYGMTS